VLATDKDGNDFVLKLRNENIKELKGHEIAEKTYLGSLDSANGFVLRKA
jgi:hypothetical protein